MQEEIEEKFDPNNYAIEKTPNVQLLIISKLLDIVKENSTTTVLV